MAVSAYPEVVDKLVTLMEAAMPAGTFVSDAMPPANDPRDFLAVGLPSLSERGSIFTGSSRQSWAGTGLQASRDEDALVRCIAAARSTNETVKDARDRAHAIVEAVQTLCRANPSLGIPQLLWTSVGVETDWGLLYETGQPPAVFVEFTVTYRARL